jgi:hypothetical protein
LPGDSTGRDSQALADALSGTVVSCASDDDFGDGDGFGRSGAAAGSACWESPACAATPGAGVLLPGDLTGRDSQAPADALSGTVISCGSDDGFGDTDGFGRSGAVAGWACCESKARGDMLERAVLVAGALAGGDSQTAADALSGAMVSGGSDESTGCGATLAVAWTF